MGTVPMAEKQEMVGMGMTAGTGKQEFRTARRLAAAVLAAALFMSMTAEAGVVRKNKGTPVTGGEGPGIGTEASQAASASQTAETGSGQAAAETAQQAGTGGTEAAQAAAETQSAAVDETSAAAQTEAAAAAAYGLLPSPEPLEMPGQEGVVTLIATGDNLVHKAVYEKAWNPVAGVYDFSWMYDPVRETICSRDLAVVNQETIFVSDYSLLSDYPTFGTPQEMGDALVGAGFDIVLSATNHTWDKQERGVRDTLAYWKTNHPEIRLLGIHDSPEAFNTIDYVEKNGIRLAMFNYTYGLNGFSIPASKYYLVNLLSQKDKFLADVRTAEQNADITVCFLHIGEEYRFQPTAFQTSWVHQLIDAGADLIICAHPHVVEPYQRVTTAAGNTGVVYYSCGNFLSTQTRTECILGGLADVVIRKTAEGTRVTDFRFIPTVTHFSGPVEQIYLLSDYTDELAKVHHTNLTDGALSVERLRTLWRNVVGE